MTSIATLTLNPTIDVSYEVDRVFHTRKIRTRKEHYNPGGGGINVARVFVRLGGNARCYYMSGGATGPALDGLLDLHQLVRSRIAIAGPTRVSTAAFDTESGREYRFVPPGPEIAGHEWQSCLDRLSQVKCDVFVASGSLPPGVPEDFYARIAALVVPRGIRMVLDSSGPGLRGGLAGGSIYLVKPSLGELEDFVGRRLEGADSIAEAALAIVSAGHAENVAVTLGHRGALLARAEGPVFLPAVSVETRSAVGAGDSFLAAMVFALSSGEDAVEALRFGMAAGAAAVLRPGADLSLAADIHRLFPQVARPEAV